jgi:dTDP-4-dehydrorhamnose 3,5-epimerase
VGSKVSAAPTIDGLTVTPLREIPDARGAVLHMCRADAQDFVAFGECYFSEVAPGAIKAWKRHHKQTQNLAVPSGRMRFVVYDARESSPTKGRLDIIELGRPDAYARLRIPPMLWYGFTCISSTPALAANCPDMPHDPTEGESLGLDALGKADALELLRRGSARL